MDYEAWRCCHDITKFCPVEGCPKSYGCARDKGWHPGLESPRECRGLIAITPENARVSQNSPRLTPELYAQILRTAPPRGQHDS